jgi:hypothetical protein
MPPPLRTCVPHTLCSTDSVCSTGNPALKGKDDGSASQKNLTPRATSEQPHVCSSRPLVTVAFLEPPSRTPTNRKTSIAAPRHRPCGHPNCCLESASLVYSPQPSWPPICWLFLLTLAAHDYEKALTAPRMRPVQALFGKNSALAMSCSVRLIPPPRRGMKSWTPELPRWVS